MLGSINKGQDVSKDAVRFLIFDIESVADGALIAKMRYPEDDIAGPEAVSRYRAELIEKYNNDFIPYTFQLPISVVVGKVTADFRLIDVVALDAPEYRSHVITHDFWRGWEAYNQPTLVSFNGRAFDIPVMELAAFRYGISIPKWLTFTAKSFEQPRNRYNTQAHIDLHDVLTNFGATRFSGGLNLSATILGKPGKMNVQGHMVQDMFNEGDLTGINDYCRCDVLDTYFVFLRVCVMLGWMTLEDEQRMVWQTKDWLEGKGSELPVYHTYLRHWGDWKNPWEELDGEQRELPTPPRQSTAE